MAVERPTGENGSGVSGARPETFARRLRTYMGWYSLELAAGIGVFMLTRGAVMSYGVDKQTEVAIVTGVTLGVLIIAESFLHKRRHQY